MKNSSEYHVFSDELLAEIKQKLIDNQPIRMTLPENGRLHIDRQLPFLIVHRRKLSESGVNQDKGTRRLLLGEASYLLTSAASEYQQAIIEMVNMIAVTQAQQFGAFLLIELWSREEPGREDPRQSPGFHIFAPENSSPAKVLDTLAHALQRITLRGQAATVKISHSDQAAPPDLPPLLATTSNDNNRLILFGLEVDAVYRNPINGAVLSFALKKLHHGLSVAFKKTLFRFSRNHTNFKPEHFHVLGRRAMTESVWEVDRQLADVSDDFDLLLHVTPTNSHAEWLEFKQNRFRKIPEFHYRPRTADPALLKRQLFKAPIELIEDPALAHIFSTKRDELDKQISLLAARGLPEFLPASVQLYGVVEESLMQLAREILRHPLVESQDESNLMNATQLAEYAREEVRYYREKEPDFNCNVEVREDIAGILVSHGNFLIGSDIKSSKNRLNATLSHEIGTHAVTHYNGRQQPFQQLYAGMAGYEELQEGLAVLSEYLVGELDISRMRLLAARVLAADSVMQGADFIETYQLLVTDYGFKPQAAYLIALRVHRGGGYTKDMVYLRGLTQLLEYIKTHNEDKQDNLDILYTGKISLAFMSLIEELRWREIIKPAALRPRFLEQKESKNRLRQLINNPDIDNIIRGLQR